MTREVNGLAVLAEHFDVFLVDQYGVLHDGVTAYPGAIGALSKLKAEGKTVVLISNSGKRSKPNEDRLRGLGFDAGSWDFFWTSGEVAWQQLAGRLGSPGLAPGTRCLLLVRDGDRTAVDGLDLEFVEDGARAKIILLAGSEGDRVSLDVYRKLLAPAAEAGVPCLCTNPDKIMLTKSGTHFAAGRIAELYEELGGRVEWIGKPFPAIYGAVLKSLSNPHKVRIIGIGDSIEHDIAGAKHAGLSAALVRSGILAEMNAQDLEALFRRHDAVPDFILPRFVWNP
ncbi:TIGR01459 family HAD-type hydrolase [soil metagenome]